MADEEQEQNSEQTETPAEAPESPQEPPEAPEAPDPPDKGEEPPEVPDEPQSTVQPQAKSEKDIEEGLKKLATSATTWRNRVSTIMGEDAQALIPCELCEPIIPGFRWPQVPDERRAAVMLAIGFEPEPDYRADTQSSVCPDCAGFGLVATGSKVQGQKALSCTSCKGKGWRGPREQTTGSIVPGNIPAEIVNGPQPEAPLDPDREAARAAAQAAGFMVIDTRAPAAT